MTVSVSNVSLSNTFSHWLTRTNELAEAMSVKAVTVNSNAAVGNAQIIGTFSANTVRTDRVTGLSGDSITLDSTTLIIANTAQVTHNGVITLNGRTTINNISNMMVTGANTTHRVLSVVNANGNLGLIKVEFPIDQLTDVDTTNVAEKNSETILKFNPTNSRWEANTLSLINSVRINTLNVGSISSTLTVHANAAIGNNTLNVNSGNKRVGVNTTSPRSALDVEGAILATGDIKGFQTSDARFKKHETLVDPDGAIDFLSGINVYNFEWDKEAVSGSKFIDPTLEGEDAGVFAQELQELMPRLVKTRPDGTLAVDYVGLIPYLVVAVQKLAAEV